MLSKSCRGGCEEGPACLQATGRGRFQGRGKGRPLSIGDIKRWREGRQVTSRRILAWMSTSGVPSAAPLHYPDILPTARPPSV